MGRQRGTGASEFERDCRAHEVLTTAGEFSCESRLRAFVLWYACIERLLRSQRTQRETAQGSVQISVACGSTSSRNRNRLAYRQGWSARSGPVGHPPLCPVTSAARLSTTDRRAQTTSRRAPRSPHPTHPFAIIKRRPHPLAHDHEAPLIRRRRARNRRHEGIAGQSRAILRLPATRDQGPESRRAPSLSAA
jgi:hypothetical protein